MIVRNKRNRAVQCVGKTVAEWLDRRPPRGDGPPLSFLRTARNTALTEA
jgi:hypothetical protein